MGKIIIGQVVVYKNKINEIHVLFEAH